MTTINQPSTGPPGTVYLVSTNGQLKRYVENPDEPITSGFRWVRGKLEWFADQTVPVHERLAA